MTAIHPHPNVKPRDDDSPADAASPDRTDRTTVRVSYDDITRRVVPNLDSSYRPTDGEAQAAETPEMREHSELETVIGAAVRAALANDHHLDGSDLGVSLTGTTATLTGSVVTDADRKRAIEITQDVPGVTAVIDELRVRLD